VGALSSRHRDSVAGSLQKWRGQRGKVKSSSTTRTMVGATAAEAALMACRSGSASVVFLRFHLGSCVQYGY
jgi:hypothetical protein